MAPAARVTTAVTTGAATASLIRHCLHSAKRAPTAEGLQRTLAAGNPECLQAPLPSATPGTRPIPHAPRGEPSRTGDRVRKQSHVLYVPSDTEKNQGTEGQRTRPMQRAPINTDDCPRLVNKFETEPESESRLLIRIFIQSHAVNQWISRNRDKQGADPKKTTFLPHESQILEFSRCAAEMFRVRQKRIQIYPKFQTCRCAIPLRSWTSVLSDGPGPSMELV